MASEAEEKVAGGFNDRLDDITSHKFHQGQAFHKVPDEIVMALILKHTQWFYSQDRLLLIISISYVTTIFHSTTLCLPKLHPRFQKQTIAAHILTERIYLSWL